jgi:hypothetical protein
MQLTRIPAGVILASALLLTPGTASAADLSVVRIPVVTSPAPTRTAGVFELGLRLPEGRGLARLLLDAGIDRDDAAAAARLGAGHLGDGLGGCSAKVTVSRSLDGRSFRLERVVLQSAAGQAVMERRGGELALLAGQSGTAKFIRIA